MDVEYTWILRQGKNCRQFSLLFLLSFIGPFVYPVEWEGLVEGLRYFSLLRVPLYYRT